jgi:hypothetical protein
MLIMLYINEEYITYVVIGLCKLKAKTGHRPPKIRKTRVYLKKQSASQNPLLTLIIHISGIYTLIYPLVPLAQYTNA